MAKRKIIKNFKGNIIYPIKREKQSDEIYRKEILEEAAITSRAIAKIIEHESKKLEQYVNQLIPLSEMTNINESIIDTLNTIINLENTIVSKLKLIYYNNK